MEKKVLLMKRKEWNDVATVPYVIRHKNAVVDNFREKFTNRIPLFCRLHTFASLLLVPLLTCYRKEISFPLVNDCSAKIAALKESAEQLRGQ